MGNNKFLSSPSDVPNLAQKEVVVKPVESAYGMEDDVPDIAYKKVAIKSIPLL